MKNWTWYIVIDDCNESNEVELEDESRFISFLSREICENCFVDCRSIFQKFCISNIFQNWKFECFIFCCAQVCFRWNWKKVRKREINKKSISKLWEKHRKVSLSSFEKRIILFFKFLFIYFKFEMNWQKPENSRQNEPSIERRS